MTYQTANIITTDTYEVCDQKCALHVNYTEQIPTINNLGSSLSIKRTTDRDYITYAGYEMNTSKISITYPGAIKYNGSVADANLILDIAPTTSGSSVKVIIPISTTGSNTIGGGILNKIIGTVSTTAPNTGDSTSSGIESFSINDFIPSGSVYNYTGSGNQDILCSGISDAIKISSADLDTLTQMITSSTNDEFNISSTETIFKNGSGIYVGAPTDGSDIYIDCQPVSSSEEEVGVGISKNIDQDLGKLFENPVFLGILGGIVGLILIYVLYSMFAKKTPT